MKYGKKITVSRQGFHIDSKLLQAVGIQHDSRCRGVFISHNKNEKRKLDDLIISPFPFSSWGCIVRLQIRVKIKTSVQDLNKILETLKKRKFNILSASFTFGGYSHNTFDLVGELYELRKDVKEIRNKDKGKAKDKLQDRFKLKLYNKMHSLKKTIEEEKENGGFKDLLHYFNSDDDNENMSDEEKKIKEQKKQEEQKENIKLSIEEINGKEGEEKIEINSIEYFEIDAEQTIKAVSWKWFQALAFNAFDTKNDAETLYFNYDSEIGLLSLENKNIDRSFLEKFSNNQNEIPVLALSTFDAENGYIRLRAFSQTLCHKEILQFSFSYAFNIHTDEESEYKEINQYGSRGLILRLLKEIMARTNDNEFKLTGISTKYLSRPSITEEKGLITIHGIFNTNNKDGRQPEDFEQMKTTICSNIRLNNDYPANQNIYDIGLEIRKVYPYTVFVSIRENFKQRINYDLHPILKKEGFDARTSGTYTDGITENVIQDMNVCDACIQIYSLSKEEIKKIKDGEKVDFVPDNSWLLFEFGIARKQNIPIIRLIDVTHLDKKQWTQYLRTDNDKLLMEFDFNSEKMSLENKISETARQLFTTLEKMTNKKKF